MKFLEVCLLSNIVFDESEQICIPIDMLWYNFHILVTYQILTPLIARLCSIDWRNWIYTIPYVEQNKYGLVLRKTKFNENPSLPIILNTLKFEKLSLERCELTPRIFE